MKRIRYYILFLACWLSLGVYGQNVPLSMFEAGSYLNELHIHHTQDTRLTSDTYRPSGWPLSVSPNDISYRFTLMTSMIVSASSTAENIYLLKEEAGDLRLIRANSSTLGISSTLQNGTLLGIGTYRITAEGYPHDTDFTSNGEITTTIDLVPQRKEVSFGVVSTSISYPFSGHTGGYNVYGGRYDDLFCKFELTRYMDCSVTLTSSSMAHVNLYLLDHTGELISSSLDSSLAARLSKGVYYLVVEGAEGNGSFTMQVETNIPEKIVVDQGSHSKRFEKRHTINTSFTPDGYHPSGWPPGNSLNDVFYHFTLETPLLVSVSSTASNVYLLQEESSTGNLTVVASRSQVSGVSGAPLQNGILLQRGSYCVVAEGTSYSSFSNGEISTTIEGKPYKTEVDLGIVSSDTLMTLAGDTRLASEVYGDPSRNEIHYKFTTGRPATLSASLYNSGLSNVNLYLLDQWRKKITSSQDGHLSAAQLLTGSYYLVVEGNVEDGVFSVNLELKPCEVVIDLGEVSGSTNFSEIFDTSRSDHRFGLPVNEIFYKLRLTREMDITLSNRPSYNNTGADFGTAIYLLDETEQIIQSSQNGRNGLTASNLSPGTYYIVSEGTLSNMGITTDISAIYHDIDPNLKQYNYVATCTYTDPEAFNSRIKIDFFDGLGRPSGSNQVAASPEGLDIITRRDYDVLGRPSREWLPRVSNSSKGKYPTPAEFESLSPGIYDNDTHPYSMPVYEASPLNRIVEQYGPGQDWHTNDKSVATTYKTNIPGNATLNCKRYSVDGTSQNPTLTENGQYAAGQLFVTKMKDEDGNIAYEFKDKLGQVILTRQMKENVVHDTYYVYNDFGDKCFVLPPRIQDEGIAQAKLDELAYQYKYDVRRRPIGKKIPGADWIYYIYDRTDQLIFTQDGNLRNKGEWLFTIPDAFRRVVLTGTCKNSYDYTANPLQSVTVMAVRTNETNAAKGYDIVSKTTTSTTTFVVNTPVILSVNYYDDYDFMGFNGIPAITDEHVKPETVDGYGTRYMGSWHGSLYIHGYKELLTGTLTAQMGADGTASSSYLYSVMYYDDRSRLIQTKSSCHLDGGIEKEYIAYDFVGQMTQRKSVHIATGKPTQTEVYTYTYDHAGRLLTTTHKLNDNEQVVLADNTYDELGRLESVARNNQDSLTTNYTYNVRSWMKSIYSPLFVQTLYYNERRANGSNTPSYNGNISAMNWELTASEGNKLRGYDFTYDALSRLTAANYLENGVVSDKFSTSYEYDKHGNMLSLLRSGNLGTTTYGLIDNLTLAYNGNQLIKVEDTAANPTLSMSMDFRNGTDLATEYTYDTNGNQIKDLNKGITNTEYNILNLPRRITFNHTSNPVNEYVYSATGVKLSVTHKKSSTEKRTDYVGNMIYENGSLKRILVEGGYIEDSIYHFYIQDHLGNNRVVAKQDRTLVQTNHYYPFGMSFAESTYPDKQPNKYNGKELDTQNGLNLYENDARIYDPAIVRTTTRDPLSENYYSISQYAWVANNPMKFVDKDGRKIVFVNGYLGFGSPQGGAAYWNSAFIQGAKTYFSDNTVPYFTDTEYGLISTAASRHSEGYDYAEDNYASLINGMKEGETFKLISHSMGGAFSTGIQQYLEEQGWIVESSIFLNTYQSGDVKTNKNSSTFIIDYQNTNDPVLFWFDPNLGYGKIRNANIRIRQKSKKENLYRHRDPIDSGAFFWSNLGNMFNYQNRNTLQDAMNQINSWLQQNPDIKVIYK